LKDNLQPQTIDDFVSSGVAILRQKSWFSLGNFRHFVAFLYFFAKCEQKLQLKVREGHTGFVDFFRVQETDTFNDIN
jgi:hypothetical protein